MKYKCTVSIDRWSTKKKLVPSVYSILSIFLEKKTFLKESTIIAK
jgi:hypothetical protein